MLTTCPACGRQIPTQNLQLHTLRCRGDLHGIRQGAAADDDVAGSESTIAQEPAPTAPPAATAATTAVAATVATDALETRAAIPAGVESLTSALTSALTPAAALNAESQAANRGAADGDTVDYAANEASTPTPPTATVVGPPAWTCSACTFVNLDNEGAGASGVHARCEMCGTARFASAVAVNAVDLNWSGSNDGNDFVRRPDATRRERLIPQRKSNPFTFPTAHAHYTHHHFYHHRRYR